MLSDKSYSRPAVFDYHTELSVPRVLKPDGLHGRAAIQTDEWLTACHSTEWHRALEKASRYALACDSVSIVGEYGTGKSQLAYHIQSQSKSNQIFRIACGKLATRLAAGGIDVVKHWHFNKESSNRDSTWLLEGIDEIPVAYQPLVVEFVLEVQRTHVGWPSIISTSKRPLNELLEAGRLREDLYYAMSVLDLVIPPLRERSSDISSLTTYFMSTLRKEGCRPIQFTREAMSLLSEYDWPGNVIELRNVISRVCVLADRTVVDSELLSSIWKTRPRTTSTLTNLSLEDAETQLILKAVARSSGNKTAAAKQLGITTRTLHNKMQKYKSLGLIADPASTSKCVNK